MTNALPFSKIGQYRVLDKIGQGGMASVYLVEDAQGQRLALKLLHHSPQQDQRWKTKFQREFRLLSRLRHPHLVQVHDYGEDHGHAYYVMDHIQGRNLWTFYHEELSHYNVHDRLQKLMPLLAQLVSALDHIHRNQIIHQDLKPANILLGPNDAHVYLADFGLARELKHGAALITQVGFIGTLGYSAPEAVEQGRMDGRTDLYSLGATLYTLLADQRPLTFEGKRIDQMIEAVLHQEPTPIQKLVPDIPDAIATMIHRMLRKDPAERYRSTRELWQEILPMLNQSQQGRVQGDALAETMRISTPTSEAARTGSNDVLLLQRSRVGRETELEQCHQHIKRLLEKREGCFQLYYGLPGIGKSFLLEEIEGRSRRFPALQVHYQRFRPRSTPYGSFTALMQQLIPHMTPQTQRLAQDSGLAYDLPGLQAQLPPTRPPVPSQHPLMSLVQRLLPALESMFTQRPQILLLDDLHHMDLTSLQVLQRILQHYTNHAAPPMMIVATVSYDPEQAPPPITLPESLWLYKNYLQPLTEEEEQAYITGLLGRAISADELAWIRALSGGLPLRTTEVIHQGWLHAKGQSASIPAFQRAPVPITETRLNLNEEDRLIEDLDDEGFEALDPSWEVEEDEDEDEDEDEAETERTQLVNVHALLEQMQKVSIELRAPRKGGRRASPTLASKPEDISSTKPTAPRLKAAAHLFPEEKTTPRIQLPQSHLEHTRNDFSMGQDFIQLLQHATEEPYDLVAAPDFLRDSSVERTMVVSAPPPMLAHMLDDLEESDSPSTKLETTVLASAASLFQRSDSTKLVSPVTQHKTSPSSPAITNTLTSELQAYRAKPDEFLLVPLLRERLDFLGPVRISQLARATFLAPEFTVHELSAVIEGSAEETLDLINDALEMRLLEIRPQGSDELYAFLHPILNSMLQQDLPEFCFPEFSLIAARAMADYREAQGLVHDAELIALGFQRGKDYVEGTLWQLRATEQAFHTQVPVALRKRLLTLHELLESTQRENKPSTAYRDTLASFFRSRRTHIAFTNAIGELLHTGILRFFRWRSESTTRQQQAKQSLQQAAKELSLHTPTLLFQHYPNLQQLTEFAGIAEIVS